MSICRWSSDDFTCDVYVYADIGGGYTTEVAGRRVQWKVELPPPVPDMPIGAPNSRERSAWIRAHCTRDDAVALLLTDPANFEHVDVPEPDGGTYYRHETAAECADNLERLQGLGLNVPQSAIDSLRSGGHV